MSVSDDERALAARVLQDPTGPARDEFLGAVFERLTDLANRIFHTWPALRGLVEVTDLIQEFVAERILAEWKLVLLLRPVADGEKPLWPRLKTSFVNLVKDVRRRLARSRTAVSTGTGEGEHDPAACDTDHWPDITGQVEAQIAAIERGFPAQGRQSHWGAVLLLSERLHLAEDVATNYAPEDGKTLGNDTIAERVEVVAGWSAADSARPLPASAVRLMEAWRTILERTDQRPQHANTALLAEVLDIKPDRWDQWVCRSRTRLAERLGAPAARRLFPTWPAEVFIRACAAERRTE